MIRIIKSTALPILIGLILMQFGNAAEIKPTIEYLATGDGQPLRVRKTDWVHEQRLYTDSIIVDGKYFTREVGWQKYDSVNNRIFFEETLVATPHHYHILDLNTRQVSDLPYDDYSEYSENILITPGSKYVIYSYWLPVFDSGEFSSNWLMTVLLDGRTLKQLSQLSGVSIEMAVKPSVWSYVSTDNTLLFNNEYLQKSNGVKNDAIVRYTLPDLTPIDTTFFDDLGWNGPKGVCDLAGNSLLIKGQNDNDPVISPGRYMFVWDGAARNIVSPFIPFGSDDSYINMITPAGDEIVLIGKSNGTIRRYSSRSGTSQGELTGLPAIREAFFRSDGNLYVRYQAGHADAVVDYKNNRIIKTITLPVID